MNAYSKGLRLKVLAAVDRGTLRKEIVRPFGVSLATIGRYIKRRRETGKAAPRPSPRWTPSMLRNTDEQQDLCVQLEESPEARLEEHRERWKRDRGVRLTSLRGVRRSAGSAGPTRKERGRLRVGRGGAKRLARAVR
jgi:transposase